MPEKKTFKATLRIPTKEPYAYIEPVVEGTVEEIINAYLEFTVKYETMQKDKPPF